MSQLRRRMYLISSPFKYTYCISDFSEVLIQNAIFFGLTSRVVMSTQVFVAQCKITAVTLTSLGVMFREFRHAYRLSA